MFHDIGFINHHYFVFGSSEIFLFKLLTKLCSNHKKESNNIILSKTFIKTHISLTINLTFNAKQPGKVREQLVRDCTLISISFFDIF